MPPSSSLIRVLVVEDQKPIRDGVGQAIAAAGDMEVAGSAATCAQAIALIRDESIGLDVALVDLGLPDGHGNEVISALSVQRAHVPSLVFTVMADETSIFTALRAGARGYMLKDSSDAELTEAIRHAETGGAPMSKEVARKVVESFRPNAVEQHVALTPREHEVLELLCHGTSYGDVARMLTIGRGTVHTHVKSIYRKLDVTSKAEATKVAIQMRLFVP